MEPSPGVAMTSPGPERSAATPAAARPRRDNHQSDGPASRLQQLMRGAKSLQSSDFKDSQGTPISAGPSQPGKPRALLVDDLSAPGEQLAAHFQALHNTTRGEQAMLKPVAPLFAGTRSRDGGHKSTLSRLAAKGSLDRMLQNESAA